MPTHAVGEDPNGYAEQLRAKGPQINAGAATSVHKGTRDSNARYNGWERGIAGESRPGGTFMPYLDAKGSVVRNKANADGTHDKAKERLKAQRARATAS